MLNVEHSLAKAILGHSPTDLVANIETELLELEQGIIYSRNETEYESCYLSSPYNGLIGYAYNNYNYLVKAFLTGAGFILKTMKMNKIVQIANFLFSSNTFLPLSQNAIEAITNKLACENPQHIIAFKALNAVVHGELLQQLKANGYLLIPVRKIYVYKNYEVMKQRRNYKRDAKLLAETSLTVKEVKSISAATSEKLCALYRQIYIQKYSPNNPQYTPKFIQLLSKYLTTFCLYEKQKLIGFIMICRSDVDIIVPLLGYDITRNHELNLYRLLSQLALTYAIDNKLIFNSGSGVDAFKKTRGAEEYLEYYALYVEHLGFIRRTAIKILAKLISIFVRQ